MVLLFIKIDLYMISLEREKHMVWDDEWKMEM